MEENKKTEKKSATGLMLFLIFFKIGAITFGGGYAMLPIIEGEVVKKYALISKEEYIDFISVAQSFPGPVAVNMAILIGGHLNGFLGRFLALFGVAMPSFLSIIVIAGIYSRLRNSRIVSGFFKGVNPVIPALLLYSVASIFKSIKKTTLVILLAIVTVIAVSFFNINPLFMIALGIGVGICKHLLKTS